MIYTPMTRKAMTVAYNAHHGAQDKANVPYIFHPMHLAEQMKDELTATVALLHDVVEDTNVTLHDLRKEGFPESVLTAVSLLTHDESVPYLDYVRRLALNPAARAVKLADLAHNSDVTRVDKVTPEDMEHLERYRAAFAILQSVAE